MILKYSFAIIGSLFITFFFFVIPSWWMPVAQIPIFTAIGGLLFSIPIGYFWLIFKQPVLKIHEEIEQREITVVDRKSMELMNMTIPYIYQANRIIVENVGRSAAKNCKGWILKDKVKERVCWTVPKERPNATINVNDSERLDFCAYYRSGKELYTGTQEGIPKIFFSDENELPTNIDIANLKSLEGLSDCTVLITSDNAEPVEAKVKFEDDKIRVEH
jgi:hypothetical protein